MKPTGLYAGLTSQITKKINKSLPFKFLWCPINKYVHIKIMAYLYLCAYLEFFRDGVESKPTQNLALPGKLFEESYHYQIKILIIPTLYLAQIL